MVYAVAGAVVAAGAPLGLRTLRAVLSGDYSTAAALRDVTSDWVTYTYVTLSTTIAFSAFGAVLGRIADGLRTSSATDPLTGLLNRRAFEARLSEELSRAVRYGSPLSLLLVDVDHLKEINDQYGHDAGDVALVEVASALRGTSRATDVAARWGGDEFILLAPGIGADGAARLADRIREALRAMRGAGRSWSTAVSIGITDTSLAGGAEAHKLHAAADAALYRAKAAGRDRVVVSPTG